MRTTVFVLYSQTILCLLNLCATLVPVVRCANSAKSAEKFKPGSRETEIQTDRKTDRQIERRRDRKTERLRDRKMEDWDRETEWQIERKTERQKDKLKDKKTKD